MPDPTEVATTSPRPLSHSQSMIWMGQRLHPEAPLYNMVLAFEIQGALEEGAFRTAFQRLVGSSDALRSVIVEEDGEPRQLIRPDGHGDLEVVDLSGEADPAAAAQAWIQVRCRRLFELDRQLYDAALLRLGADHFVWYLCQHHLITDAWSKTLCFERMQRFYQEVRDGRDDAEHGFPPYRDYVEFERTFAERETHARAVRHWQGQLAEGYEPIPFYGRSPTRRDARTERVECELGPERSARLRALAREPGVAALTEDLARFHLLATALCAFLHRVGGRRDLAFLTPAHNRTRTAFKNTIGLFIEVFPMALQVDENETYATLLAKVKAEAQAFLMQALPGTSQPSHSATCDVLLNYIHRAFGDFAGLPTRSEWVHPGHGDPAHSLRLQVHDFHDTGSFVLHFDFNCDRFGPADRSAAVRHFLAVLDGLLEDRSRPLAEVPLTNAAEQEELLHGFDHSAVEWPPTTALHEFTAQATRTPHDPALRCEGTTLSYAALDKRSNQLARYLAESGVAPGATVALLLGRSPELLVATLAVWKVGATYLPLDPLHPADRQAWLLEDSGTTLVLTSRSLRDRLAASAVRSVDLDDTDRSPWTAQPADPLPQAAQPEHLAYLIYTSGSTGRPKGVMVSHGALANYLQWARGHYLDGQRLAFALHSSVSVDLTVSSLFLPLVSGGEVVIYPEDGAAQDLAILRVFEEDAVDVVKLTPTHLRILRQHGVRPRRLRKLIVGGEDLRCELAQGVSDLLGGDVELFNEYGPTEATVGCLIHRYDPLRDLGLSVPIGRPVANARAYLLDAAGHLLPEGLVGELYVAGAGLAEGYRGDPERTAECFVEDPFHAGHRMYRTGDLARRNRNGELVYLGRADHQVKVRGARVEPGEVEACLSSHPHVAACVVGTVEAETPEQKTAQAWADLRYCRRCGLASNHPDAHLDEQETCRVCHDFDAYRDRAQAYFRTRTDLDRIFQEDRAENPDRAYDCLMMLSGGKDSTYALYQLVEMGLKVLVFSLDNGYISEEAKANVQRTVDHLGVELVWGRTSAMDAVFAESLDHFSNVCQGCFKVIYTLGMNLARERGIPHIVTGLSRGQIFETRLAGFYKMGVENPGEIDRQVIEARKAYHRMDDVVARRMDVAMFQRDETFDQIRFVDFYRYTDVTLDEMRTYLDERTSWTRPSDTGRSTNCLINETGIYVHRNERGYHNYALPYSWDVRLGHKERDAALAELDDEFDLPAIERYLGEVGYRADADAPAGESRLVAWWVARPEADPAPDQEALREHLAERLPAAMVPSYFVRLEDLPVTSAGKVDRGALPSPRQSGRTADAPFVAPRNDRERRLARLWAEVLGLEVVGVNDHFLSLGGDSIITIRMVSLAGREGLRFLPRQVFDHPTVAELALVVEEADATGAEDPEDRAAGPVPLTPIQHWYLDHAGEQPEHWNQALRLHSDDPVQEAPLRRALATLARHHDALRLRFRRTDAGWHQELADAEAAGPSLDVQDLSHLPATEQDAAVDTFGADLHRGLDLERGPLVRCGLARLGPERGDRILLAIHHLVVDAVSWTPLLEDLEIAYEAHQEDTTPALPAPTTAWRRWALHLQHMARTERVRRDRDHWQRTVAELPSLPVDHEPAKTPTLGSLHSVSTSLDPAETRALLHMVQGAGLGVPEVLITAVTLAVNRWQGRAELLLDLEGHGRQGFTDGLDTSRTVGWFTALFPVRLRLAPETAPADALRTVHQQVRATPNDGLSHGLLRYLGPEPEVQRSLAEGAAPPILFNYLGRWEPPAGRFHAEAPLQLSRAADLSCSHVFEIHALIRNDRLELHWNYSEERHRAATLQELVENTAATLRSLIQDGLVADGAPSTPADFPDADLSQEELDDLLREFGDSGGS